MYAQKLTGFLSDKDFNDFVELFKQFTGIHLKDDKRTLIEYRMGKRLTDKNLEPQQYLKLVKTSEPEKIFFINQLTTHKTEWFRENEHFDFLREKYAGRKTPLYVWSAACSTGEEVYSTMITLGEMGFSYNQQKILGTDISSVCVGQAQKAVYPLDMLRSAMPEHLLAKYFVLQEGVKILGTPSARVNPKWSESIAKFRELNLTQFTLPAGVFFDVIFIRNVLIYFEPTEGLKILKSLLNYLKPNGHLILGLTEPIQNPQHLGLKRVTKSIYTRE